MSEFINELGAISPLLPPLGRALIIMLVGLICWFVASVPIAVLYTAVRSGLRTLAEVLRSASSDLWRRAMRALSGAAQVKAQAVDDIRIRYIYTESEAKLHTRLRQIKLTAEGLERTLDRVTSRVTLQIDSLRAQIQTLAPPTNDTIAALSGGQQEGLKDAISSRRSALIAICIVVPLIIALITVNSMMLMKFFESFFDDYISYRWGIKLALVLGIFFSAVELAFGFIHFYLGRRKGGGVGRALGQVVILACVLALACVEFYLYMLMSAEISRQLANSGLQLPAIAQHFSQFAVGPFGFVMVCALAFTGFIFFDALIGFSDAGVHADLRKSYRELVQAQRNAGGVYEAVKAQANAAKASVEDLHGESGAIAPAASAVRLSATELREAVHQVASLRRDPVSERTQADAAGFFDTQTAFAIGFLIAVWAFCWLQFRFLADPQSVFVVHPALALVLAAVEAFAIVVASYKAYPPVSIVTDHRGVEAIRPTDERLVTAACCAVVALALIFNIFMAYSESTLTWVLLGSLGCLIVLALVLLGRTLPSIAHALRVLGQQVVLVMVSVVISLGSSLTWLLSLISRATAYLLFCLSYPFLYLVWRAKLISPCAPEQAS